MINKTLENYFALTTYQDRDGGPTIDYTSDFIDWNSDNSVLSITMEGSLTWAVFVMDNDFVYAHIVGNVAYFNLSAFGNDGDTFRADKSLFYFAGTDNSKINVTAESSIIITSASYLIGDEGGPETTSLYLVKEASGSSQTILTGVHPDDFSYEESKPDIIMTPVNTDKTYYIAAGVWSSIEAKPDTDTWMVFDPYLLDEALIIELPELNELGVASLIHINTNHDKDFYLQNVNNIWLESNEGISYHSITGNYLDNEIIIDVHSETETSVSFRDKNGQDGGDDILHGNYSSIYAYGYTDTIAFDHLKNASLFVDFSDRSGYFANFYLTRASDGVVFENRAHYFTTIIGTPNADKFIGDITGLNIKGAGGRDYVIGSTANDTLELDTFEFIDGRGGIDTLITSLNRTSDIFNRNVKNIEVLDITQKFHLQLDLRSVKRITDSHNTLTIEGDYQDKITFYGNAFRVPSDKPGYDLWQDIYGGFNPAKIYIDKEVFVKKASFFPGPWSGYSTTTQDLDIVDLSVHYDLFL